jgi:NTE family protein
VIRVFQHPGGTEESEMGRIRVGLLLLLLVASCAGREVQPPPPPPKPAKIAVVLGAGAARGFAHIGVLKVLEAHRIPVHMIVGTSAGSFVGCLSAYGYDAFQIQKMSFLLEKGDLADYTMPDNGFIKGEKLEEYINKTVNGTPMERLKTPFYAVATNIQSGEEMVFDRGNTGTAVRASSAMPGVFRPVKIGSKMYVDGGVVSPVAVDAARRLGADIVIAVDISSGVNDRQPETTVETLIQSINIMYEKLAGTQLVRADIVIKPKVAQIGSSDFTKKHEAVLEGEKAAQEALPKIEAIVSRLREEGRIL